jgi:hypothetical protein
MNIAEGLSCRHISPELGAVMGSEILVQIAEAASRA